ncbi:retrotransposon protein, putative, ty1-copia subclass [Tanacetum coccineum]
MSEEDQNIEVVLPVKSDMHSYSSTMTAKDVKALAFKRCRYSGALRSWYQEARCRAPGKPVSEHVLEMKGLMDQLHTLGKPYDNDMAVNLINMSLNKDFGDFVRNFNMHIHALLIDFEKGLKDKAPTPQVFTIQKGRDNKPKPQANKKVKGKGKADKNKQVVPYQPKPKPNPLKRKENPNKDQACHHCHVAGHWKRNCPLYIEELRANKKKSEPGFKEERKLSYGDQYLQVGNGTQAAVEAIGIGVVSLSCLLDLGFHHTIASNGISVSLNGIFYFSAISVNGVFEIDINNNVPKNNSIFSINKKRKLDLDSSYLWHCRLAHIGKTRMQKLHREGLLENIDEESFDKCESCISGKMTKKPFNKNIERATDLLGLIHTDVCGPLRHVSRKGASYFLTFTDDFSRYGYVYLLKHKHEVFETFKVFKAEVELQLGRRLIALRSCYYRSERTKRAPNRAMDEEMNSMKVNEVWTEVDPPPNAKIVRSKWIFKKKTDMDGKVHTYKARLVAKGCTQTYGVDYEETFSPVADIRKPIRISIAYSSASIYGLKQAHRQWNKRFDEEIKDEEKAYMKKVPYASAVGSIMYAVRCTRPDVAFAQNLVSRYQQNPGKLHWVAVKHILKYLRNTKDMFLVYGGNPDTELDVIGAVDSKSKKQTTIAMHATQSEYMAASKAAMEAVWIRKFVGDLGVIPSINKPINMYCDNFAAIIFANEPGVMKGAKHFLRRYHYVREQVESGEIKLIKVHTDKNLADAFTKALPRGKVNEHANGIGLRLASSFMHICD